MKTYRLYASLVLLLASGCRLPWSPENAAIVGTVVYPNGVPARTAKVSVVGGGSTFTTFDGSFRLGVPPGADSVTVQARDGYDGRPYAVTHAGTVRVKASRGATRVRIALTEAMPI
jgi:hypothetical protein